MDTPHRHHHAKTLLVTLCMTLAVVCAPGCRVVGFFFPSEQIEIATDPSIQSGAPAPVDSASTRGLEVRLWVVDDTAWTATRLLQSQIEQSQELDETSQFNSIGDDAQSRWNAWGFRVVMIPVDQVQGFLGALRPLQPTNVQWLGEFGQWRPIIRAGNLASTMVRVDNGVAELDKGKPRLIARSWVEPIMGSSVIHAGVRLDLAMQIETNKRSPVVLVESARENMVEDDGPIIDELICSTMFDGTHAMVIVGDAPDEDWSLIAPSADTPYADTPNEVSETGTNERSSFGPSAQDQQPNADQQAQRQVVEPIKPITPTPPRPSVAQPAKPFGQTLGELMLTTPGSRMVRLNEARTVPRRVVVVLIPRTQGGFTLIPSVPISNPTQGSTQE